jgi:DNA repair protein RecO (recombination protein O)
MVNAGICAPLNAAPTVMSDIEWSVMEQPTPQPAYVLHSRAYKETSALVDFLTPQGKVRAVLRRARGKGGSLVRPFVPLEVELRGRGELKNVGRLDAVGIAAWLHGDALFSGLYLNELLMRLLPAEAPHPALFEHYTLTLQALAAGRALEPLLRSFEWRLLDELGYAFTLDHDVNDSPVVAEGLYRLQVDAGLERVELFQPGLFKGGELLALAQADWEAPGALLAAKRLMRQALAVHLGPKPLVSRELFRKR